MNTKNSKISWKSHKEQDHPLYGNTRACYGNTLDPNRKGLYIGQPWGPFYAPAADTPTAHKWRVQNDGGMWVVWRDEVAVTKMEVWPVYADDTTPVARSTNFFSTKREAIAWVEAQISHEVTA